MFTQEANHSEFLHVSEAAELLNLTSTELRKRTRRSMDHGAYYQLADWAEAAGIAL